MTVVLTAVVALVLIGTVPMTWLLMLALGNLGLSQYGFVDCLPMAMFAAWAFGCARPER